MSRLSGVLGVVVLCLLTSHCNGGGGDVTTPRSGVAAVRIGRDETIDVTQQAHFVAEVQDANGQRLDDRTVQWSSSNEAIAKFIETDETTTLATFLGTGAGVATITATCEGKSGTAFLTVRVSATPTVYSGRVYDATSPTQAGIPNATVTFTTLTALGEQLLGTATTAADGSFSSPDLSSRVPGSADMAAAATGYVGARLRGAPLGEADLGHTIRIEPIPLVPASSSPGGITGTVRNARDFSGIANAEVKLFTDIGFEANQEPVKSTIADGAGAFSFTQLAAGTYTVNAVAPDFFPSTRTSIAVGNNNVTGGQDVILSPGTAPGEWRIILEWGPSPTDLDAHLTGPNPDGSRFHVYFPPDSRGNLTAAPFAALDHDDTDQYGPETITISQLSSGNYRYSVHDFSNRHSASSTALGSSGAHVTVFGPRGRYDFFVPIGMGNLWTVFEVTPDGPIQPRDELGFAEDPTVLLKVGHGSAVQPTDADLIGRAVRAFGQKKVH